MTAHVRKPAADNPAARGPKATASNGSDRAHRDIGQRHNRANDRQTWTGITR